MSLIDVENAVAYAQYGVHVVSVDDSGHVILSRDVMYQFVNHQ